MTGREEVFVLRGRIQIDAAYFGDARTVGRISSPRGNRFRFIRRFSPAATTEPFANAFFHNVPCLCCVIRVAKVRGCLNLARPPRGKEYDVNIY